MPVCWFTTTQKKKTSGRTRFLTTADHCTAADHIRADKVKELERQVPLPVTIETAKDPVSDAKKRSRNIQKPCNYTIYFKYSSGVFSCILLYQVFLILKFSGYAKGARVAVQPEDHPSQFVVPKWYIRLSQAWTYWRIQDRTILKIVSSCAVSPKKLIMEVHKRSSMNPCPKAS